MFFGDLFVISPVVSDPIHTEGLCSRSDPGATKPFADETFSGGASRLHVRGGHLPQSQRSSGGHTLIKEGAFTPMTR
jgi:hypothetical protein